MKQDTSTPNFLSHRGGEGPSIGSVECSLNCDIKQQQHRLSNVELSPSPSVLSTETRRVSSASSDSSNASSSGLSCISSSESSSIGFKTYDEADDSVESISGIEEDDPIISFEALSLDTHRITSGVRTTPKRIGTTVKAKSFLVLQEDQQRKKERIRKRLVRGMDLLEEQEHERQEPPIKSLDIASPFEGKEQFTSSSRQDFHSGSSLSGPKKDDRNASDMNSFTRINVVPFAHASEDLSAHRVAFPEEEKHHQPQHHQQRRTIGRKYTIKKTTNTIRNSVIVDEDASKVSRTKRQRGGSDFTMASASGVGDAANTSSITTSASPPSRKRRRVNRNRAMAADEFDSILSQINTTGSL